MPNSPYRRLCLAAFLLPSTASAQSDADFEAALRSAPPRVAPPSSVPAAAISGTSAKPVHRGTAQPNVLPEEYRRPLTGRSGLDAAKRAADKGLIDAVAWADHHLGPVPMLPGTHVLRCVPSELRVTYTFGIEGSAAFRQAIDAAVLEEAARSSQQASVAKTHRHERMPALERAMAIHGDAAKLPATAAKLREAAAFLRTKGFVPYGGMSIGQRFRRADAPTGKPTMDIELIASPLLSARDCFKLGVAIPSGPIFYVTPAYPSPDWTDSILSAPIFR